MAKRDYYKVLDLPRTATEAEIKKSYRRLAMKYHPDRNPGDHEAEEHFKEAKEAYEVLSDATRRAVYDQYGHQGIEASRNASSAGAAGGFHGAEAFSDIFGDVFGDIFGGARRAGASQVYRGADLRYEIGLDLAEAVFGRTVEIDVNKFVECEVCHGSGAARGSNPVTCDTCSGTGQVRVSQGFFTLQQTCPHCRGSGRIVRNPCDTCLGQGRIRRSKKLSVKIPAGVDTGDRVRLAGEGEAGRNGGPPGDLYVEIHEQAHPQFTRDHDDLHCKLTIPMTAAALGTDISLQTLDGEENVVIKAGTQAGSVHTLRGRGVPHLNRGVGRGDLHVHVEVVTPTRLDAEQERLLRELAKLRNEEDPQVAVTNPATSPGGQGLFSRLRDAFK